MAATNLRGGGSWTWTLDCVLCALPQSSVLTIGVGLCISLYVFSPLSMSRKRERGECVNCCGADDRPVWRVAAIPSNGDRKNAGTCRDAAAMHAKAVGTKIRSSHR
eukprot:scaffold25917_cov121-Isochrysis_galbana.AAC.5